MTPIAKTTVKPRWGLFTVCETLKVIDRLDVMGFTLRRAREDFEELRKSKIEEFESWVDDGEELSWFEDEWNFLKRLTFDDYAAALREVMTYRLRPFPLANPKSEGLSPTIKYILAENDERLLGFFCSDIRSLLRLACELVAPETYVVQDMTELIAGGYYGESEPVCANLTHSLTAGHPENSRRIILTEGSTDSRLLRDALDLLYPHLSAYYSFMDFDSSRSQGGAGIRGHVFQQRILPRAEGRCPINNGRRLAVGRLSAGGDRKNQRTNQQEG